jgi:hypothetical protein
MEAKPSQGGVFLSKIRDFVKIWPEYFGAYLKD